MRPRKRAALAGICVALTLLVPSSLAGASEDAAALNWQVARDDFVNYSIVVVKRTDSKHDGFARWDQIEDVDFTRGPLVALATLGVYCGSIVAAAAISFQRRDVVMGS